MTRNPIDGRDLFDAMADAAALRASAHLTGTIWMARCDSVHLKEGFAAPDVEVEVWPVSADHRAMVISVFATASRGGGQVAAGSGRFTFTTLTNQPDKGANSASVQPHGREIP